MASQEQGWDKVTSKSKAKKDKERELQQAMKQQHADYLHNRDIGLEDELEDLEYVAETPEHPTMVQYDKAQDAGTSAIHDNIRVLPAYNAWLRRVSEFELDPRYHKRELELVKFDILEKDRIVLDEQDIIPVSRGWGACLLGRFTGRFPGKEAIQGLMRRWPCKSRVTYHSKGWLIFQFGSDEDRETVRQKGPFEVFGIPLVLQPMPENFEPDMEPEMNVPLWIRLVDLPLGLWNFTAISKIASCFGTPLSTDFSTLRRESLDGPRVQVITNTAIRPKTFITVQLPNGPYEQKIEYEFFPSFCNACKIYGHFADECRGRKAVYEQHEQFGAGPRAKSKERTRSRSRPHTHYGGKAFYKEWPKPGGNQGRKNSNGVLGAGPAPLVRSSSRPRQEWVAKAPPSAIHSVGAEQRGEGAGIEVIPTSPNRFEALAGEDNAATETGTLGHEDQPESTRADHIEKVKELLTVLAELTGKSKEHRQNGRDRSRDPRPPRGRQANSSAEESQHVRAPEEGVSVGTLATAVTVPGVAAPVAGVFIEGVGEPGGVPRIHVDGVEPEQQGACGQLESGHADPGVGQGGVELITTRKKGKKGKKSKDKEKTNENEVSNATPVKEPQVDINVGAGTSDQDGATERMGRPLRVGGSSVKISKKSKSRSKSRGKNTEDIPSDWEEGLDDDPGIQK